ncbi:MAG: replication endonuclease [Aeromonadaceae bacterium]
MYDYIPQDDDSQLEYDLMLGKLKPWVKAAGMATMNTLPTAKVYSQVLNRLALLQEINSHLNEWTNQIHDLGIACHSQDKQDRELFAIMKQKYGNFPLFNRREPTSLQARAFRSASLPLSQMLSSLKRDHASEVEFCRQCLDQLDIYNTIDHRPRGSAEFRFKWSESFQDLGGDWDLYKLWNKYMETSPAKELRDHYFFIKLPAARDEISDMLIKGTISSRRSFSIQRILHAITQYHNAGWYMVFDTLTLADDRLKDFYENETALRDHFRNVGRLVLKAEGRKAKESFDDCFQYFCVPEYGTQKGRLHFHAVYFMRTLPAGSVDPNIGLRMRVRRQLNSLSGLWPYGFTQPIAVRYSGDAFSRSGWLWPVDKQGKPIPAKPPIAVGYYVAKYVNKKADTDLILKNTKGTEEWNKSLKASMATIRPILFRVRMSRRFGMNTPCMSALKMSTLLELTKLSKDCTPYPTILKQNAKRELRSRLGTIPLFTLQDAKPETINLLASLRNMTRQSGLLSLQNFIASIAQKLTPTDISKETQEYLNNGNLAPIPFNQRPTFSGGGK